MKLQQRCEAIELILSDVDGVLTDGTLWLDAQGVELKGFSIRDGLAVRLWQRAGHRFGLVTARSSQAVKLRAAELGITLLRQGSEDKLAVVREVLEQQNLEPDKVCYIGDDLPDLPVLRYVGLGVAVADAAPELRQAAHLVTQAPGGRGAVRETVEVILKAQGRWEQIVRRYESGAV